MLWKHFTVICCVYVLIICLLTESVLSDDANTKNTQDTPPKAEAPEDSSKDINITATKAPPPSNQQGVSDLIWQNQDMLKRALYVTFAVSGILIVYFGIRFIRARRRRTRRYGRLVTPGRENMEMAHLASDEDEDVTVFDARQSLMK